MKSARAGKSNKFHILFVSFSTCAHQLATCWSLTDGIFVKGVGVCRIGSGGDGMCVIAGPASCLAAVEPLLTDVRIVSATCRIT